jgi:transaldolase/glucose-6-phosphate isomerase
MIGSATQMTDATALTSTQLLPAEIGAQIDAAVERAVSERWATRLWHRDAALWTADSVVAALIGERLGWLDAPAAFRDRVEELEAFAEGVRAEGFEAAVVCGMGGSSLAPEVLARAFPLGAQGIPVRVLDSTDPAAVRAAASASDPKRTLYIIATKSGTTTETLAFLAHLWQLQDELHTDVPAAAPGQHFVAITDPGRSLERIPHTDLFRSVFLNPPDVGGRYSALTYVGLVPAALLGLDLGAIVDDAVLMAERCREPEARNPGLWLGVALGTLARAGRDKLTLVIEPRLASFGGWLEQLVAESTGKRGLGIVPIDGEPLAAPELYGDDRVFVRIGSRADVAWRRSTAGPLEALAAAGQPVIDLPLADGEGLGGEFFRWEFATAVAGAVLGVNPFDEPNVTESKQNTQRVLDHFRGTGELPIGEAVVDDPPLRLFADAPLRLTGSHGGAADELRRHLERTGQRGYVAVHAYVAPTAERDAELLGIQQLLRDSIRRPTTVGYGPRFLHSTGQLHKGGPPIGCFIQLVAGHPDDLRIPGWRETFGTLIDAQALGDFNSLEAHELPVVRVHLGNDPDAGLAALRRALGQALS